MLRFLGEGLEINLDDGHVFQMRQGIQQKLLATVHAEICGDHHMKAWLQSKIILKPEKIDKKTKADSRLFQKKMFAAIVPRADGNSQQLFKTLIV